MNWYIAKIVFQIPSQAGNSVAQFEEHLRLVLANSYEQAFLKAKLLGIREEASEKAGPGRSSGAFVNIAELYPLDQITDGIALSSRIHETREAGAYIESVHRKASELAA